MKIKESRGRKIFKVFNYTFLALLGAATFYPFWYVLIASFNTGRDFMRGGVWLFPREFTLENYQLAFEDPSIVNALVISVLSTVLSVKNAAGTYLYQFFLVLHNNFRRRHGSVLHGFKGSASDKQLLAVCNTVTV